MDGGKTLVFSHFWRHRRLIGIFRARWPPPPLWAEAPRAEISNRRWVACPRISRSMGSWKKSKKSSAYRPNVHAQNFASAPGQYFSNPFGIGGQPSTAPRKTCPSPLITSDVHDFFNLTSQKCSKITSLYMKNKTNFVEDLSCTDKYKNSAVGSTTYETS